MMECVAVGSAVVLCTYLSHVHGTTHYDRLKREKLFDVGHEVLPMSHMPLWTTDVALAMLATPLAFHTDLIFLILPVIGFVFLLRALTSNATILPRDTTCDPSVFGVRQVITGHCFDKLFSGHMAFATVLALAYAHKGIFSWGVLCPFLMAFAGLLISTRSHYTTDVILGAVISYLTWRSR
jgi:hypothetical protein